MAADKVIHRGVYALLRGGVWLMSLTPLPVLHALSTLLYYPMYYVVRYRRGIVRKNLQRAFPEKSEAERAAIGRRFYRSFADTLVEAVKMHSMSPRRMMRHAVFRNVDMVRDLFKEGKSISVYIGHMGNWEWIPSAGLWFADDDYTVVQIFRRLNNRYVGRLVDELRTRFYNESVDMHHTARYIAEARQKGRRLIIGFLADQSPKRREAKHFVEFFGRRVPVLTGTEKVTKHFGHKALFLSARRVRRGYYEFTFEPLGPENPADLPDFELTRLYFERLERDIRECPEMYLWTHNRFKYEAKPDDE